MVLKIGIRSYGIIKYIFCTIKFDDPFVSYTVWVAEIIKTSCLFLKKGFT